ncbi:MAG: protease [Chlamydiae bacterium CG10_big_fil_rev_8_21_14_0_10_42_34]|nr:MAG: protease [Chlamydiae bacterium CG10_big_fil_rev_8_21_14_0_10_42_34]
MKQILFFADETYEDLELWYPKIRMEEEGYKTVVAAAFKDKVYFGKHGYPCKSDISYDQVDVNSFSALVIAGGYAPDKIRRYPKALEIVRQFNEKKALIAFICHAGWVPISAKILKNKKVTGFSAIRDDLENAGAQYVDEPVVIDGHLITSRTPQDLPHFCKAILEKLKR